MNIELIQRLRAFDRVTTNEAADLIEAQANQIAELQGDAERYRWLRQQPDNTETHRIDVVQWQQNDDSSNSGKGLRFDELDLAIDEAMKGKQ